MRIEELRLIAYGPFTDCTIKLQPGFNVLYGPNEAGKSSALRAVHTLLFGFEHKTSDDFLHNYQKLRVGAVLVDSAGQRLECVRRKGRSATLRDGDDKEPLDESRLLAMLGGVGEDFFLTVFGIDHQRLREGGEDVVRGEGRIGELLFAAGGVTHLRDKQQAIEKHADQLYRPRASNPQINQALSKLRTLADEVRELQRSPEKWAEHDKEHRRLTKLVGELTKKLEEAESARARLERIRSSLGVLTSWKTKRGELASLDAVVMLPSDADERFQRGSQQQSLAESEKRQAESRIVSIQEELQALEVPTELLGEAERVNDLYLRLGNHRKDSTDLVGLKAQQRTARDDAQQAIEMLGWEMTLEEAAEHRLADEKKALVRRLATRHGEVTRSARDHQRALKRLKGRRAELDEKLAESEAAELPAALKDKQVESGPLLEMEGRLAEQSAETERLKSEAEDALSRLARWSGTLDDACRLKTPSDETVEAFDDSLRELRADETALRNQVTENQEETDRVSQELQALELAESVPTDDELRQQRSIRDQGVELAVRELRGERVDTASVETFVSDVGDGEDLSAALEPSVRNADLVADRLRRESKRVAQKSQLLAKQESLASKASGLVALEQDVETRRAAWDQDWRACWESSGIDPATPAEMRSWLRRHAAVVSLAADWRSAATALSTCEERVSCAQEALAGELAALGAKVDADTSLRGLSAEAGRRLEAAEAALRDRDRFAAELERTISDTRDVETERLAAEEDLAEWREAWADALKPLRLGVDALPEQAEAVLTNLDGLFEALDERTSLGKRIWGIEETARDFVKDARAACESVAADLLDAPVEEVASMLNQRLTEAKEASQKEDGLRSRLVTEQEVIKKAEDKLSQSRATLDALVVEAGCQEHTELPSSLDASTRKRRLVGEVEDLRSQLTPFCAGKPLEEFVTEAEREDPDRLPSQIDQLAEQVDAIKSDRDEAIRAKEETAGRLRQFVGDSAAADKAEERQFLLSQLEEDARDYAVALVASRLLQHAVERYQEKSQGPVLARASDYFAKLTCGCFDALRPDLDESGQQVLLGSRIDGAALTVQAMSEGTRDQLYLALRLGTVEHWLDQHSRVPMVVDDILLTFDDERAAAALSVLSELSKRTQVLFFTHHEHLLEIAGVACTSDGRSGVHEVRGWSE